MLCQAAHHAARPNHPQNPYVAKLCARRGYKMAMIAVAHRLCRIMFAMLRHATDFRVDKLAIEQETLVMSVGLEPIDLYGALLVAGKHGAAATPNG